MERKEGEGDGSLLLLHRHLTQKPSLSIPPPWSSLKCFDLKLRLEHFAFQLDEISQSSQDESGNRIDPYLLKVLELLIPEHP